MLATDGVSDHYCSTFVSPPLGQSIFFFLKVKGATRMRVSQRLFCSVLRLAASNAWGYLWKHLMAKLLGLRHGSMTKFDRQILGNTESGWCLLMKNRALHWIGFDMNHVNILRMIWSKGFERNRRENARNGWIKIREKGGGKKWPSCFDHPDMLGVFENPFCAWSEENAWSEEKAVPRGLEFVRGMLWYSLFPGNFSIAPLTLCFDFIPILLGLQARKFLDFFLCSSYVCALCCDVLLLRFARPARGPFGSENSVPDCWCVVWKLRYSSKLCVWGILGYEKIYVMLEWIHQIYPVQSSVA